MVRAAKIAGLVPSVGASSLFPQTGSVGHIVVKGEFCSGGRDDPGSLFRLRLDKKVVGEHLTAVQTHLLVGEILDRITLPRLSEKE
jgi:hypothetical protein